jgi:hypothetical protein
MSSALFGRGTNTQVGGKRRAEEQDRAVLAVRTAVDELKAATVADVKTIASRLTSLEATLAALQKTVTALSATVASLSAPAAIATPDAAATAAPPS